MSQPIIYIDTSRIKEKKLEQLKAAMKKLTSFVEKNMPRIISYAFYFNKNETEMFVISVHPDSESLEFHMNRGREEFRKFSEFIDLLKIEVYGRVSKDVLEKLNQKAKMLGNGTVDVHSFYTGFSK